MPLGVARLLCILGRGRRRDNRGIDKGDGGDLHASMLQIAIHPAHLHHLNQSPPIPAWRASHTATLLPSGRIRQTTVAKNRFATCARRLLACDPRQQVLSDNVVLSPQASPPQATPDSSSTKIPPVAWFWQMLQILPPPMGVFHRSIQSCDRDQSISFLNRRHRKHEHGADDGQQSRDESESV